MERLLAVGLDAADLALVERLADHGRLPHLGRLLASGARAEVTSPWPYRAELPWTCFLTGHDAARTGYWGTVAYDPASYAATEVGAYVADPFYAVDGLPVVAFDLPHSVLSDRVTGTQVTAWGAHSPQYPRASRPAGLVDELDRQVGVHPAFDADSQPGWWSEPYLTSLTAALLEGARRRAEAFARLLEAEPGWRLAITAFSEPHAAGHHLWHGVDPDHPLHAHPGARAAAARLEAVYRGVDEAIGRLLHAVGEETTVAVFAVHGSRSNGGDLLALHLGPELLHRDAHGWARLRSPRRGPVAGQGWVEPSGRHHAFDLVAAQLVGHRAATPATPPGRVDRLLDAARRARRAWRAVRPAPGAPPWYRVEPDVPPESRLRPGEEQFSVGGGNFDYLGTSLYERYWPHQRSFALPTFSDLHVRVNLAGREARGVVPADGLDAEVERVAALLGECRDARTGGPVVAEVVRGRDLGGPGGPRGEGDGPGQAGSPPADLVVLAAGPIDSIEHPRLGRIGPLPFLRTGEHSPEGWLVVAGPRAPRLPARLPVTGLGRVLRELTTAEAG